MNVNLQKAQEARKRGDFATAEALAREILKNQPNEALALWFLGVTLHLAGRSNEGEKSVARALEQIPHVAACHNDLGCIIHQMGDARRALKHFERAAELDPAFAAAYANTADALTDLGELEAAVDNYRNAVTLNPRFAAAWHNLAATLMQLARFQEALDACQAALSARPDYALAMNTKGAVLARLGRHEEAVAACRQAIALRPDYAKAWRNLGISLGCLGLREESQDAYRRALAIDPNFAEAHYDLAAAGAVAPPPAMPVSYVRNLFDTYAPTFDEHLVGQLNYRVPEQLLEAAQALMVKPGDCNPPALTDMAPFARAKLVAADLGCGTGLVGKLFRPMASKLVGVDLSPRMLQAARRTGVYDELFEQDVASFLTDRPGQFDLILAADVFIYIGDLSHVFRAAGAALHASGLFAFSIEVIETDDYILRPTRRYAQSLPYIQRLAHENQFIVETTVPVTIRAEADVGAAGLIVVCRKPV